MKYNLITVAGLSCSGKSTLCDALKNSIGGTVIHPFNYMKGCQFSRSIKGFNEITRRAVEYAYVINEVVIPTLQRDQDRWFLLDHSFYEPNILHGNGMDSNLGIKNILKLSHNFWLSITEDEFEKRKSDRGKEVLVKGRVETTNHIFEEYVNNGIYVKLDAELSINKLVKEVIKEIKSGR